MTQSFDSGRFAGLPADVRAYYLDEFTFRFNRRRSRARGLLFHRLVEQAVAVGPAPRTERSSTPAKLGRHENESEGDTQFWPN